MLICPYCSAEVIEGSDNCDACQQALTDLSIPVPVSSVEACLMRDTVSKIPVHTPVTVPPTATVGEVLRRMVDDRIGCVLVVAPERPERLAGIFSERDALMKLNTEAAPYRELAIERFMSPNPAVIPADAKIAFALHKMNVGGYRHLPVMEGNRAVSVISVRDVLRYLTKAADTAQLGDRLLQR